MNHSDVNFTNEQELDTLFENILIELPPEDVVNTVTPWKKTMKYILTGIALKTLTLNFLSLNYILPAIGTLLTLLGFRSLRQENRWFKSCFYISVIQSLFYFFTLTLNTTIWKSTFYASQTTFILTIINHILLFIFFLAFWLGLRTVQQKAGLAPHAGSALALIFWYALLYLLALFQYNGILLFILMLLGYISLLLSLYKLSKEFDYASYAIKTAPIRISNTFLLMGIVIFFFTGCICGYLFGNSYPMKWTAVEPKNNTQIEEIKEHLISTGFPTHILDDIDTKDLLECKDALYIRTEINNYPVNEGRQVTGYRQETSLLGTPQEVTYTETVYDVEELQCTSIAVRLSTTTEQWKIFHHFRWTTNPGFYGTESLRLSPSYHSSDGWESIGDVSGRLLYEKDGISYTAPYHSLNSKTYTSNNLFENQQTVTDIFATFSLPNHGENQRGYLSYTTKKVSESFKLYSSIHYTHQSSWKQYPVMTAQESSLQSLLEENSPFKEIQDILLFHPHEETKEISN